MVKVQRVKRAAPQPLDRRAQDMLGLLLFFLGAASLLCLSWRQPAPLPVWVDHGLRLTAGTGAYAIPLLLMFAGTMFLAGYERLSLSHSSLGTLLLLLVFITGKHLAEIPGPEVWQRLSPVAQSQAIEHAGGWIGALFGSALRMLVGDAIGYLFLVFAALAALVLLVDQPFIELMRRLHVPVRVGASAVGRGLERNARTSGVLASAPEKEASKAARGRALEAALPETGPNDRAQRAAQVVERALSPAARPALQTTLDLSEPGESGLAPASKLLRMFSLARQNWRGEPETGAETENNDVTDASARVSSPNATTTDAADAPIGDAPRPKPARAPKTASGDAKGANVLEEPASDEDGPTLAPPVARILPEFVLPPLTLLAPSPPAVAKRSQAELTDRIQTIERTLEQFNIGANVVEVASGPSVTRYEIQLAPGIKVSKIVSLADNLAMSLAAIDVRVEAPIPGKSAIGLEVPNATPVVVSLREVLDTDEFRSAPSQLTIALGKDVSGQFKYADLAKMPHLLIGGSTNSGKSVCLNALIASLVYRATPRQLKLLMIDPKRVELSLWDGIPHLMHPVVKDVKQAAGLFRAALKEMDRRYDLFATLGTRNIDGFNQRVPETEKLPYLVLIVDELADLMIQQGPEVETSICRLAQLARATGIHLVIATQRPSVDIITGTIKANIASRIAFAVASQVDSRTILDMTGADRLIGRGDMLFLPIDASKPLRIQGCYLSETDTNALVDYLKQQEKPDFAFAVADPNAYENGGRGANPDDDEDDEFFEQAVRLVVNNGQASTSMLQRRFRIGYTRAARIVEMMEQKGLVGPLNGAKPREICVSKDEVEQLFNPGATPPSVANYHDDPDSD